MVQKLRIAVVGDVHGAWAGVARVRKRLEDKPPDFVVLVGDIGSDILWPPPRNGSSRVARWRRSVERVLGVFEGVSSPVVLVPGNHDRPDLSPLCGAVNLDGRVLDLAGLRVFGFGGAGPAYFGLAYEWRELDAQAKIDQCLARTESLDLCVSHAPPRDCQVDCLWTGTPVGSWALRGLVERFAPRLFLCGHIHESVGHGWIGDTLVINAGRLLWADYTAIGRPRKGARVSLQYYLVGWEEGRVSRLERIRFPCTGSTASTEHLVWTPEDRFGVATDALAFRGATGGEDS